MEVQGSIKVIGEVQEISATFKKRELVVSTDEQYPQTLSIEFIQDKTDLLNKFEIGQNVNIGAGTITCNYDGVKKNKTKIKDNVFVGSNSSLVAPVTLNKKSIIGAGSVITKNVSNNSLSLTRSPQLEIKNYKRKKYCAE